MFVAGPCLKNGRITVARWRQKFWHNFKRVHKSQLANFAQVLIRARAIQNDKFLQFFTGTVPIQNYIFRGTSGPFFFSERKQIFIIKSAKFFLIWLNVFSQVGRNILLGPGNIECFKLYRRPSIVPAHGSFTHYCNLKIMVHGALVARQTVGQGAVPGSNLSSSTMIQIVCRIIV